MDSVHRSIPRWLVAGRDGLRALTSRPFKPALLYKRGAGYETCACTQRKEKTWERMVHQSEASERKISCGVLDCEGIHFSRQRSCRLQHGLNFKSS